MDKGSISDSSLSLDSLEQEFQRKTSFKDCATDEDVETIMVPFYENDVLIKIPKDDKRRQKPMKQGRSAEKAKPDAQNSSYLVNRERKAKLTYLEMFRKQFAPQQKVKKKPIEHEIRSLSPEFGDTERESIIEDVNNPVTEFYNTESYNEMYYEKLMNRETENYLSNSQDEEMQFNEHIDAKSRDEILLNNLKSVSEVSQPRRHLRRATVQPIQNVKLGGLGPDMENIKPRLERARSLQRYSEKVRMENRLKIYKKSVQAEMEKKERKETEKEMLLKHSKVDVKIVNNASYLMNKSPQQKNAQLLNKLYAKSKSADARKIRSNNSESREKSDIVKVDNPCKDRGKKGGERKQGTERTKSSTRNKGINTDCNASDVTPPVHINFMVNVGGTRPSTALKKLEEKHRMYQEKVKAFKLDSNKN